MDRLSLWKRRRFVGLETVGWLFLLTYARCGRSCRLDRMESGDLSKAISECIVAWVTNKLYKQVIQVWFDILNFRIGLAVTK